MASITKTSRGHKLRWRDPDGRERSRTLPTAAAAKALRREVEEAIALGKRWTPADVDPVPLIAGMDDAGEPFGLLPDYLEAHRGRMSERTLLGYDGMLRAFAAFLGRSGTSRRLTVDLLTRGAIERWWGVLTVDQGLSVGTARNHLSAIYAAWEWAYDSDEYGRHVARPRRISVPTRVTAPARAPTWAQMDALIRQAESKIGGNLRSASEDPWVWRYRLLVMLRCTGLRVGQVMRLTWDALDLDQGELVLQGELGKSRQERSGRRLPLAPVLVEEMAGWGVREGYVIGPTLTQRLSRSGIIANAWRDAQVPGTVWEDGPGRRHGMPHHAIRKGFKTGLAELGVAAEVRDYLVGHHRGINEIYEDLARPAREAVQLVPPISPDPAAPARVISLGERT